MIAENIYGKIIAENATKDVFSRTCFKKNVMERAACSLSMINLASIQSSDIPIAIINMTSLGDPSFKQM